MCELTGYTTDLSHSYIFDEEKFERMNYYEDVNNVQSIEQDVTARVLDRRTYEPQSV